jgi:glyoxalase-like protein
VEDLDVAAEDFASRYGLLSLSGGSHPGRGTANRIVPLGDSYLELIAVVDQTEAERFPSSQRVRRAVETGRAFAGWAVRTDDLEDTLAELSSAGFPVSRSGIAEGRRRLPDGRELAWRSAELVQDGAFGALPFLIEWRVPSELFPGAAPVDHPGGARGVRSMILSDSDPDQALAQLRQLLAGDFDYAVERGRPGVAGIVIDASGGTLRVG